MKLSTDNTARSGNSDLNSGEAHVYDLRPKVSPDSLYTYSYNHQLLEPLHFQLHTVEVVCSYIRSFGMLEGMTVVKLSLVTFSISCWFAS